MKKFFTLAALLLFAGSTMFAQGFITKALDPETDEPTFDWSKAEMFIPMAISESVGETIGDKVAFDATFDGTTRFFDIWPAGETYVGVDQDGSLNSFGQPEDHIALDVTGFQGWSGLGFRATSESQTPWETVIDDTWVFHFAMKSIDNASHRFSIGGGDATFTIGDTEFEGGKVIGNIPRDGEWYYIDIPYSVIRQLADVVWAYGNDGAINYLTILSGGVQGTQLRLDNMFWYKDNTIVVEPELPTGDVTGDKIVDVEDVNAAINIILKVKTNDDYPGSAEMNGDGIVDVEDVNAIINIILNH